MGYCGVDFLLEDHTKPLDEQDGAICEINAMAALPVAEYPVYGTPRRLSEQFILRCVEAFGLESWPERAETLNLRLTIHGGVTGVGYGKWFTRRASKSGLSGWFRNTGERCRGPRQWPDRRCYGDGDCRYFGAAKSSS